MASHRDPGNSPAGWIPPEYRQIEYAPGLRDSDLEIIRQGMSIVDIDDDGNLGPIRVPTDEEITGSVRRITGVTDKRTGHYQPNTFFED